jgi:HEAT repeat protein
MKPNTNSKSLQKALSWKKFFVYGLTICFTLLFILLLITLHWTSSDVRATCKKAQQQFEGDCVEALIAYLQSDSLSFKEQNHVIWALGEIGDKRALPVLQKLYTGKPCLKPCDSSKYICQYGIKKAIRGCKGFNVVRYVWQWI